LFVIKFICLLKSFVLTLKMIIFNYKIGLRISTIRIKIFLSYKIEDILYFLIRSRFKGYRCELASPSINGGSLKSTTTVH